MKRPSLIFKVVSIGIILGVGSNSIALADDSQEEFEGQQFLFMNEDAYTQEQDQWQLSFTSQYLDRKKQEKGMR